MPSMRSPLLIDEMQKNNGEEVEHQVELGAEDFQDGPVVGNDGRVIMVDDDMAAVEEEVVLRDGRRVQL